jgi:ferritin-like metal-binding protein YciE
MIDSLKSLLISQLRDLHDAENRYLQLLRTLQSRAKNSDLGALLGEILTETDAQIARLAEACGTLDISPEGETCEATRGLVKEAETLLDAIAGDSVADAAIIVSVQRIEHYQIASYGSAATFAEVLNANIVTALMKASIAEEKDADNKLKKLATGGIFKSGLNEEAAG